MSAVPPRMIFIASPMAWPAEAQAVTTAAFGPFSPWRIETWPGAALAIILGTKKGETRSGPLVVSSVNWASISAKPPIPDPRMQPIRVGSSSSSDSPESSKAISAAATANWEKRSIRRASFPVIHFPGSKSTHSPPIRDRKALASKSVSGRMPLRDWSTPSQVVLRSLPRQETAPKPVIAIRRSLIVSSMPQGDWGWPRARVSVVSSSLRGSSVPNPRSGNRS